MSVSKPRELRHRRFVVGSCLFHVGLEVQGTYALSMLGMWGVSVAARTTVATLPPVPHRIALQCRLSVGQCLRGISIRVMFRRTKRNQTRDVDALGGVCGMLALHIAWCAVSCVVRCGAESVIRSAENWRN